MNPEPTSFSERKAALGGTQWQEPSGPAGSKSGACMKGSPRNLGGLDLSTPEDAVRVPRQQQPRAARGAPETGGSEARAQGVELPSEGNEARRGGEQSEPLHSVCWAAPRSGGFKSH